MLFLPLKIWLDVKLMDGEFKELVAVVVVVNSEFKELVVVVVVYVLLSVTTLLNNNEVLFVTIDVVDTLPDHAILFTVTEADEIKVVVAAMV